MNHPLSLNAKFDALIANDLHKPQPDPIAEQIKREVSAELRSGRTRMGVSDKKLTLDFDGYQSEIDVEVRYEVIPAQNEVFDCPGSPEYVDIEGVYWNGEDITKMLNHEILKALADEIRGPE